MVDGAARGIRNNNPLNIIKNANNSWQGLAEEQIDPRFCSFENPSWGFRAAAILLIRYYDTGFNTISKIVNRWAPDFENNTSAYVADIANRMGLPADRIINLHEYEYLAPLIRAMCIHENGSFPYSQADLDAGLLKAGVTPPLKPISHTGTAKASTIAVAATGVSAFSQINESIHNAQPAFDAMDKLSKYGTPVLYVVILGAVAFMVWDFVQKRKQVS